MDKLWNKNRGLFWIVFSIFAGIIWGLWKESFWAGFIYASMILVGATVLELYRNRDKK